MLRIALIGCGNHSKRFHAPALARYAAERPGQVELAAACDLDAARAGAFVERFGFRAAHTDLDAVLAATSPDACLCIVPVLAVVPVGVQLLEAGIPCVIEKPLGAGAAEARRLAEVAASTGTPHMISMNRRFAPALNRALDWTHGRSPVRYLHATMARVRRDEPDFIWGTAIHLVDAAAYAAGPIARHDVAVMDGSELAARWYSIRVTFAGGARGTLDVLPTAGYMEESYDLFGEGYRATAALIPGDGPAVLCRAGRQEALEWSPPEGEPPFVTDGAWDELCHFIGAIESGEPPRPSAADVLPQMELCFRIAEETRGT